MVKPREHRVPFMLSDSELTAIDDWRFANRIGTRSEAVRRLCQIGIGLEPLVFDLKQLGEDVAQAQIDIRTILTDAIVSIDADGNGATPAVRDNLEAIRQALNRLVPTSMELGLQAAAMADVFTSLTSGKPMESSLDDMKRRLDDKNGSRQFIRKTFGAQK